MKKLSIIIPCYNEEENIKEFFDAASLCMNKIKYELEFVFINDGSKDNTLDELKKLLSRSEKVKIINFSRNFGKDAAIYAGLQECVGDYAVLIDADMQQHPKLILPMLKEIEANPDLDIVAYYQENRIENKVIAFLKHLFYKFINSISEVPFRNNASDFRLFNRDVIDTILSLKEHNRFHKGIFAFIGFNTKYLPYVPLERYKGKSSFNLIKLIKYAFDGILSFSDWLIKIPLKIGAIEIVTSLIWFIILFFSKNLNDFYVPLFIMFVGFLQLSIGILCVYSYRIYKETMNRPNYIIKGKVISNEKN